MRWFIPIFLLAAINVWIYAWIFAAPKELQVSFLDVGQGDAVYIQTPSGHDLLIDGGAGAAVLRALSEVQAFGDRYIDVVVATHPDKDHIGGLIPIFQRYEVGHYIHNGQKKESETYKVLDALVRGSGAAIHSGTRGMMLTLGNTTLHVAAPLSGEETDSNEASIVSQLSHGDIEILFMGDAGRRTERVLLTLDGEVLESEVLKVGHHGSKTSSDKSFIDRVNAQVAIISAGANNAYGHPHQIVRSTLQEAGAALIETARQGTITLQSDGLKVRIK